MHAGPVDIALLDSCLQVLGAAALAAAASASKTTRVLSRIGRLHLFAPLTGSVLVHARFGDVGGGNTGEVAIYDSTGTLQGVAEGVRLAAVSIAPSVPKDWFYALKWEPCALAADTTSDTGAIVGDAAVVARLRTEGARLADVHGLGRYAGAKSALDRIVSSFVVRALTQLHDGFREGAGFSTAEIVSAGGVVARQIRLLERLLQVLEEDGLLCRSGDHWLVAAGSRAMTDPDAACLQLERELPEFGAEITLTRRCGASLAAVLRGEADPLQLLAPGGSFDVLERLYIDSPSAKVFNQTARQALESAVERQPSDRAVRVLEIGAGTGGTTTYLIPVLESRRVEYAFTDVSPAFTTRAQQRFGHVPGMRFGVLDVERSPAEQGYQPGSFDIVIAANVLHATEDIRQTVRHARQLLRPGGLLLALEGTQPERWVDLTFGMTEGWWKASDDLRDGYPLMSAEAWSRLLGTEHFSGTVCIRPAADAQQALLLSSADERRTRVQPSSCLIVGGANAEATALGERLAASDAIVVRASDAAAAAAALVQRTFDHLVVLPPDCKGGEQSPHTETVLELMRRLADPAAHGRLWLVTHGAQAVNDAPSTCPEQAALWGLGRTFSLEQPDRWGGLIDLDRQDVESEAGPTDDMVALELLHPTDEDQIAYRDRQRFVARLARIEPPAGVVSFDRDASYLITGGLGRLGLRVAQWMAAQGARHLVLVGRTAGSLTAPSGAPSRAAQIVEDLTAQGVSVAIVAADVATADGMRVLRAAVAGRPLKGIVHAAAVFDAAPLADVSVARLQAVLRPKAEGCRRLADSGVAGPTRLLCAVLVHHVAAGRARARSVRGGQPGARQPRLGASRGRVSRDRRELGHMGSDGRRVRGGAARVREKRPSPHGRVARARGVRRGAVHARVAGDHRGYRLDGAEAAVRESSPASDPRAAVERQGNGACGGACGAEGRRRLRRRWPTRPRRTGSNSSSTSSARKRGWCCRFGLTRSTRRPACSNWVWTR